MSAAHHSHDCQDCHPAPAVVAVKVTAQPSERRQGQGQSATMLCCGCCCCCCCCLHTVGGIIGAAVAGKSEFDADRGEYGEYTPSAAKFYWPIMAVCSVLAVVCCGFHYDHVYSHPGQNLLVGGFLLLLGLPVVQLVASAVSALVITCAAHPEERGDYLWSLGKITLGSVAGTVGGVAVMAVMCVPFMMR